jgi:hypothetical protein
MTPAPFQIQRARRVVEAQKDGETQTQIVKSEQYHYGQVKKGWPFPGAILSSGFSGRSNLAN